ncbi:hypothetical protein HN51_001407 [Arachis hypogaea]
MASACSRIAQRAYSFSCIKSSIKSTLRSSSFSKSATNTATTSSPLCRSILTRVAPELRCAQSLLPLHSAVATARMTSCLSTTSRSCRALSQEGALSAGHIVNWEFAGPVTFDLLPHYQAYRSPSKEEGE